MERESPLFQELAGMRQSVAVSVISNDVEPWELHLKPSKGYFWLISVIFGYLCKPLELQKVIQEQADMLLRSRKLPLVLDLDDTLVRVVGNQPGRYVPESQAQTVPHRVRELKDGRKVVLAERVHEFLQWASKFFDISVCSLGDQPYVDMVVQVLNSEGPVIRGGVNYSARGEYLYISHQPNSKKTPKDLNSLYAFYHSRDSLTVPLEPLILDDNASMWPYDQQDNIIVVREISGSPVWNVSLFTVVQQALQYIYDSFFRGFDAWVATNPKIRGPPPNALFFYKEFLRKELSNQMADRLDT